MVAVVAFLEKNVMSSLLINIFDSIVQSTTFHSEHDSQIPTNEKTKKQPVCKNTHLASSFDERRCVVSSFYDISSY